MNHKCPICSKDFDSLDKFDDHIESHKEESILSDKPRIDTENYDFSETPQKINLDKIFNKEKFEKLTESKIHEIDNIDELIHRRNFVEQVKKIYGKNPFCYVPNFVKDLMEGIASWKLEDTYHILHSLELHNIVKNILGFKEERYRLAQYPNAFELNSKNFGWKKKYDILVNNFDFFEKELLYLYFENVLQAYLVLLLMDKYVDRDEIYKQCLELKFNYQFFRFIDNDLAAKFNSLLDDNLKNIVDRILDELLSQNIICFNRSDTKKLKSTLNIDDVKNNIKNELKFNEGKLTFNTLQTLISQTFPSLKLIPDLGIFDASVGELEDEKFLHKESRSNRKNDYQIFLSEDFEKIESEMKSIENTGKIPFKGRKITPEKFIFELLELEKGDFNDDDDQVTRLAGLVLAESVSLQSTPENIPEFDFTINFKNYDFRPEQLDAMAKLNFTINSEIFHVKAMINESLTLKKYQNLIDKLPNGEQCVVITFKTIPLNVRKLLKNDSSIQIIDEEGVKIWVSISSILPSRVNSICKIHLDPLSRLENKLVKINSVFYEKGIALVTVFPEMNEETVLARSLEEIQLYESRPIDFSLFSKNYFEFIKILSNCTTPDDLIDGFFTNKFTDNSKSSKLIFKLNFDYNEVNLNLKAYKKRDIFNCNCMKYAENPLQLCSHLVTTLNYAFRNYFNADDSWNESNQMKEALEILLKENVAIILDKLEVIEEFGEIKGDQRIFDYVSGMLKTKKSS